MRVKVVAVEAIQSGAPLEAVLVDLDKPERGLMVWWGGYAWETLAPKVMVGDVLSEEPSLRPAEMELPNDWEEGYLKAADGEISFVYGRPPGRNDWRGPNLDL
jgi:hypothetical protein